MPPSGRAWWLPFFASAGAMTVRSLRKMAFMQGYVLLGWMDAERQSFFNPPLDEEVEADEGCTFIVLGEN